MEEMEAVKILYGDEISISTLDAQISLLRAHFSTSEEVTVSIAEIVAYVNSLETKNTFMSEVVVLIRLILVSPATNATSERSFSALRRLKTYLRSTMTQQRLNHCALLHVLREECDELDLRDIAKDFVGSSKHRYSIFGHF